ncbi:MAG: hypothetical protein KGL39_02985 [Patescibacteria group bacterium]|nr:hypothetical protein [Patescibacteria group bacterium]
MKVEYRVAGAGGNYAVLFDASAGDASSTYKASFEDKAEINPGFGAASQGVTPNANTLVTLEIPLTKVYADQQTAKAAIRAYRAALRGLRLNLKVTVGNDVDFWPSAVLKAMTADLTGQAVDYSFTFNSQDVTNVEPP